MNQLVSRADALERQSVPICQRLDVIRARQLGCNLARAMGFGQPDIARMMTAISEVTRNVLDHSGTSGEVFFEMVERAEGRGLHVKVVDNGCGIASLESALQPDTSSSVTRLGAGLPSSKRIMSEFAIESKAGSGTEVSMVLWLNPASSQ